MRRAERRAQRAAEEEVADKERFVDAFTKLHEQGKPWVALGEVTPVAASQNGDFVRQRKFMRLILGAPKEAELPEGLEYPPKTGPQPIIDQLLQEGILERVLPDAVARGLITHPHRLSTVNDGHLYRLTPDPEPVPLNIDVAITA